MHGARPLRQDRAMKGESETATRAILLRARHIIPRNPT